MEEIRIGSDKAHVADTSGRKDTHVYTSPSVEAQIVSANESLAGVGSSSLSWLWCPSPGGYAEEAETGMSGVGSQPGLHFVLERCIRVLAALQRNKFGSKIPAGHFSHL